MTYRLLSRSAHDTGLDDESVRCIVTSPPYWGLRKYEGGQETTWPSVDYLPVEGLSDCFHVDAMASELGLEPRLEEYIGHLVLVFREMKRVLRSDGVAWLNLGDTYESKNLCGIPWRVAFALQADGWYLRSDVIWWKKNPFPENVKDRPTRTHEYIFLLAKSKKYYYDVDAIREEATVCKGKTWEERKSDGAPMRHGVGGAASYKGETVLAAHPLGRNKRTVWHMSSQPYKGAHFATYPKKLIEPMILAGSKRGDTVLDPFSGSGTTGVVSLEHWRHYIGIDINDEYNRDLATKRLDSVQPRLL